MLMVKQYWESMAQQKQTNESNNSGNIFQQQHWDVSREAVWNNWRRKLCLLKLSLAETFLNTLDQEDENCTLQDMNIKKNSSLTKSCLGKWNTLATLNIKPTH